MVKVLVHGCQEARCKPLIHVIQTSNSSLIFTQELTFFWNGRGFPLRKPLGEIFDALRNFFEALDHNLVWSDSMSIIVIIIIIITIIIIIIIDVYTIHWDFWLDLPEFCINIDIFFFMNILLKFTVQLFIVILFHFILIQFIGNKLRDGNKNDKKRPQKRLVQELQRLI